MSGGDDERDDAREVTTKTPSLAEELKRQDVWRSATPVESDEAIDADYAVPEASHPAFPFADEDGFTEAVEEAWEEAEEVLEGDGPFAVPVDGPPASNVNPAFDLMSDAFSRPPAHSGRPGVPLSRLPRSLSLDDVGIDAPPLEPHILTRKTPPRRPGPTGAPPAAAGPGDLGRRSTGGPRRYPQMLALLEDQSVARRPGRVTVAAPPPVPGTFFPAPREPMEHPEPTDLDQMLLTMAEGLLIGESPDGGTEVRVTLKDEFFAGTELRISTGGGKVRAVLVPPDRHVYRELNASLDELKRRLTGRGLDVEDIELVDP